MQRRAAGRALRWKHRQNAIATLLQRPTARAGLVLHVSGAHKTPTARDIPPVTLTDITRVDVAEFKPYIAQVGALYEQLRRAKASEDEYAHIPRRRSSTTDGSAATRAPRGPPPLSTVPAVYFDKDFHLQNPRTFDVVSERSEVVRPPEKAFSAGGHAAAPRRALATNAILQEKLSWYMDTVEAHLVASVAAASATVFAALGSLRELRAEAAGSAGGIHAVKSELAALDGEVAAGGLRVVQQRRRRANLRRLHDAVLQLKRVVDGVAACESLVDCGELENALESIDSLEKLIAGEPDLSQKPLRIDGRDLQLRDLRGAAALRGVGGDLGTLRLHIGKAYEARFLGLLMGDLRRHADAVSAREVLIRWTGALARSRGSQAQERPPVFPSYMSSTDGLRPELLESITGLHRAGHLAAAAAAYRDAALEEIRSLVWRPLPSSSDDDSESATSSSAVTGRGRPSQQQKSSIVTRNVHALEPEDAEELLVKMYVGVAETLRRLTTQVKLLLDVASSLGGDDDDAAPQAAALRAREVHQAIDLPDLLGQAVDAAQDQIVELLRARSEQSASLPLTWFLRYFTLNLCFAGECESVSGRSGGALKAVVNGQIRDFVRQHGDAEEQKLARAMETDQWEARDFSDQDAAELGRILSCSTEDPAAWSDGLKIWIPYSEGDPAFDGAAASDTQQPGGDGRARTRSASIGEETFVLPSSAVLCMHGLSRFLRLAVGIPSTAADVGTLLVSYLQLFAARCAQLVLDAGARQSAGLRSITSKHLALASQALAFVAALTSHVREFVRRHAGSGAAAASVVVEFDKVRRLCLEHQGSMRDKVVEIMSRLAASHVEAMKNINWDDDQNGKKKVHPYMATLARDTTALHRILARTLPEGAAGLLMAPVFASYKAQLGQAFQEVDPATDAGRDSMLRDVAFFASKLGRMDGFGDAGDYLTAIIESKQVKSAAPAAPAEPEKKDNEETEKEDTEVKSGGRMD